MSITIRPNNDLLAGLAVLRKLGPDVIDRLIAELSKLDPAPLSPKHLRPAIKQALEGGTENLEVILRQLLGLYSLCRESNLNATKLVEGLHEALEKVQNSPEWDDSAKSKWRALEPKLTKLLDIDNVRIVVKALDLTYEYANLLQSARIVTDIRPIFTNDDKKIAGTIISHTLRIYYGSSSKENHNLSITLDIDDVKDLLKSCKRALLKADTAKTSASEKLNVPSFIAGEEEA